MAINSIKKGKSFENQVCHIFKKHFRKEFSRVPSSGAIATTRKDQLYENAKEVLSGDIICPPKFRFSVECKSRKDFSLWELLGDSKEIEWHEWFKQARQDAQNSNRAPLVVVKYNNRKLLAFLSAELIMEIEQRNIKHVQYEDFIVMLLDKLLKLPDNFFFLK